MRKIIVPKEKIEEAIKKYPYKKDACKWLGIGLKSLNRLVNDYSLTYPSGNFKRGKTFIDSYIEINKQWLIDNWLNTNLSLNDLSAKYDIPLSTLEYRASKYKLTKSYKYDVNDKIFDLSDVNLWYLAGLIASDGYLEKNADGISITLVGDSEYNLLKDIASYYSSNISVRIYNGKCNLRLSAKGLKEFFSANFNIPLEQKTYSVKCPVFPEEKYLQAYLRGLFDGDGYISASKNRFSILSASDGYLESIASEIERFTQIKINVHTTTRKNNHSYYVIYLGGKSAKTVLSWIYSLDNCFFLERKFSNFKQVNDIV